MPEGTSITDTMRVADEVLRQAISGVASLITSSQLINVDFADVRSVMRGAGMGLVTIGRASGPGRAEAAAQAALSSPLLDVRPASVRGLVYSVAGPEDMSLQVRPRPPCLLTRPCQRLRLEFALCRNFAHPRFLGRAGGQPSRAHAGGGGTSRCPAHLRCVG